MNRRGAGLVAVIAIALVVVALRWWLWTEPPVPDAAEAPAEEVAAYLASDRFGELSDDAKADYLQLLREQPPERLTALMLATDTSAGNVGKLRRNMRGAFMTLMLRDAREYAALPEDRRTAYVDEKIDDMERMMESMRAMQQQTGGSSKMGPPWMHEKPDANVMEQRMQQMLSDTTPRERAEIEQYMTHMMGRFMQRGVMRKLGLRE